MKNIIVESSDDQSDDIVMEMADQLRNEGFHEGFSQGIRYGLKTAITLKFGDSSDDLLNIVNQVNDVEKLTRINEAIMCIDEKDKLIKILA